MYIDPIYWYFALPGFIITIIAQIYVKIVYGKYNNIPVSKHTGMEVAKLIKNGEQFPVEIYTQGGKLEDYFDPTKDLVNISADNMEQGTVANIAVVAHEFGHVQQKFQKSPIFRFRMIMTGITKFTSSAGYILFLIGILLSALKLAEIGLIFFSTSTLFALITIPVEVDASKRGMGLIKKYELLDTYDTDGAKQVLTAAALTYIAGFLSSALNLLYYINILGGRRRS
jgi:Zn-dependent membrane protease YugP